MAFIPVLYVRIMCLCPFGFMPASHILLLIVSNISFSIQVLNWVRVDLISFSVYFYWNLVVLSPSLWFIPYHNVVSPKSVSFSKRSVIYSCSHFPHVSYWKRGCDYCAKAPDQFTSKIPWLKTTPTILYMRHASFSVWENYEYVEAMFRPVGNILG